MITMLTCTREAHFIVDSSNQIRTRLRTPHGCLWFSVVLDNTFVYISKLSRLEWFLYIAFLRFIGDDNDAKNYSYNLEVRANGRKMVWQGVPRSMRQSQESCVHHKCFVEVDEAGTEAAAAAAIAMRFGSALL